MFSSTQELTVYNIGNNNMCTPHVHMEATIVKDTKGNGWQAVVMGVSSPGELYISKCNMGLTLSK